MKYTPSAKRFGQLLVQHGFISKERLEEALHHQETTAPYKPLGELCVELGFISSVVLKVVLDRYRKGKLLGKVLLDMGVISVDQLREALSEQKRTGNRLGHILLERNSITKAELAQALSIQLGIPKIVPNAHMVDQTLISRANAEYFRKHRVVPLGRGVTSDNRSKEIVTVLMEDPLDMTTLAELEKIFNAEIRPAVSASIDVDDFLHEIFDPWARYPISNEADSVGAPTEYNHANSREVTNLTRMRLEERSVPIPAKQGDEVLSALPVIRTAATVPDVPTTGNVVMTEPAEDSPSLDDLTPGTRMRLEKSRLALNPAHQNIAREVEQDRAAEAEVLLPVLPSNVGEVQATRLPLVQPTIPENKPASCVANDIRRTKRRPQRQNYSKISDLTKPSNVAPEAQVLSPIDEVEDIELKQGSTSRTDERREHDRLSAVARTSDKWPDLGVKEDIKLSAPSKAMVIEADDCDATEVGRNAVTILNSIVFGAVHERASDIHIEPLEGKLCVRYRIDGVMRHQADLPKAIAAALTTRIKVLSGLDIAERRRHQDGRIEARVGGRDIDLRVSTYASLWGENVVIRILNRETALVDIDRLGFSPLNLMRYLRILSYPAGVMLVTGPTGSGKTTTLYASLMRLRDTGIKIITVEDPIEYTIDGVVQGRLDSRPDLSYEDFIKSMMRQDPDVIMIGEIRDAAGAAAAMQASLTGHKVLTSFHTDDTVSALLRLMDMGIQPFLISSTIAGITAQRLVRMLCPFCRELARPEKPLLKAFTSIKLTDSGAHTFYRAVGCPRCAHTGYRGRTGVHELLEITEPLKEAILARKTAGQMRLIARESAHLISMAEDGFYKAAQGITTLEEVLRLVSTNACDASVPFHEENLMAYCDGTDDSNVLQLPKARNTG